MPYYSRYSKQDRLWTVGSDDAQGNWQSIRDCESEGDVVELIHYLNGGVPVATFEAFAAHLAQYARILQEMAEALEEMVDTGPAVNGKP